MQIKIGCDLAHIKRFKQSVERGGSKFLDKIFTHHELAAFKKPETLAGIFTAKEAILKALGLKPGDWQKIEIMKNKKGRPKAKLIVNKKILSQDIAISHDGEYVLAVAIFLLR